ncbi:hypothetical protein ACG74X_20625, partial [Marivita sp. S0852]
MSSANSQELWILAGGIHGCSSDCRMLGHLSLPDVGITAKATEPTIWYGSRTWLGKVLFLRILVIYAIRGKRQLPADSVEKLTFASAESDALNRARAPFWSGFARLLRCGKDLG